ncbi:MAG: peptidylprolyl isomerase [Pseudomonadota bacterium]
MQLRGVGFCVVFLLAGCGGGGSSTPPPLVVNASVENIIATDQLTNGVLAHFTVNGQHLDQGISLVAPNCSNIAPQTGGSATQQTFTCTPNADGALALTVTNSRGQSLYSNSLTVAAAIPAPSTPTISSITPGPLMYGKVSRFTVVGRQLDKGVTMTAPTCTTITPVQGGTATTQVFSCTPIATGVLTVTVMLGVSGDVTTLSISPNVPQPQVTLTTSLGDVVLELNPASAPITVKNYLQYVADDFYKDKIFHRVIGKFMIQGGGFDSAMQFATTRLPIKLEAWNGLHNERGTVAMARTDVLNSATSQFFINVVDNLYLDATGPNNGYAVFGKVVAGMDVVDTINAVPTHTLTFSDVPVTPVVITAAAQTQ